jgi:radical SAM superfamily enzyme YgiQ (UPF0313 family)
MTLDLLLINPGASDAIYSGLGDELVACEPNLWVRLIAGYVRDLGFSVAIMDAEAEGMSAADVCMNIGLLFHRPRLICIVAHGHQPSSSAQTMHGAHEIAAMLDDEVHGFDIPVIMVGGYVAALPEKTLRDEPIDYACNGEGFETIVGLLRGRGPVPGLVWRDSLVSGRILQEPRAAFPNMKDLHGDVWDLLPMHAYAAHPWQCFGDLSKRKPYASIYTSLNCSWRCKFCCISAPFGDNKYRTRNPENVVAEILMLERKYGVQTIKIVDEMFVLKPSHYTAICQSLIESGWGERGGNAWAYARIDTVKPDTLGMFRRAGIRWLALGIESGSKHVRDGADKALKSDDIVAVVRSIESAGINVIANYIFGLPDDDLVSMQETLDLAMGLNTSFANFYSAQAYPGSALYAEAVKAGARLPDSYLGFSQHAYETHPLDTLHVRAEEVLRFRDAAFQTYYRNPRYLSMIREKFGAATVEHIKAMTAKTIRRKLLETA